MASGKPPPTRLGRPAEGLARYYLDCGWWRAPSFDDLSAEALVVWQAAVSYSNEHTTDGRLPASADTLSLKLGMRVAWVRKATRELVAAGRWRQDGKQLVIVGYLDHNPSKAEVQEWTAERSQRGTLGNHRRWHEARGLIDPDCVHCRQNGRSPTSPNDHSADRSSDSVGDRSRDRMGWDGMGNHPPHPLPSQPSEPVDTSGAKAPRKKTTKSTDPPLKNDDGDYQPLDLPTVGQGLSPADLWPEMARRRFLLATDEGRAPTRHGRYGWLQATAANLAAEYHDQAVAAIADTQPDKPADYVIWELDPTLALRDWRLPLPGDRPEPIKPEPAPSGAAEAARAALRATRKPTPDDPKDAA